MLEIKAKLKIPRSAYKVEVKGQLALPFAARSAGHLHARLASGEEVCLALPRGEILRGGDLVTASDGRVIEVLAEPEKLLQAESASGSLLAKAAYRLGDQHVPVQVGDGFLRLAADAAQEEALRKMGFKLAHVTAPFEPDVVPSQVPHQGPEHDHGHGHRYDHDHGHDHGHRHEHDHDHGHGHRDRGHKH